MLQSPEMKSEQIRWKTNPFSASYQAFYLLDLKKKFKLSVYNNNEKKRWKIYIIISIVMVYKEENSRLFQTNDDPGVWRITLSLKRPKWHCCDDSERN